MRPRDSVRDLHAADLRRGSLAICWNAGIRRSGHLRELLAAIEEKHRLVSVLNACIETPEPVFVQIGIKEISQAGHNLALISAPYSGHDQVQGSLGVLGPRALTTNAP